jgi:hypothetical protein
VFFDRTKSLSKQQIRLRVIHDALREQQSSEGLSVAATLLLEGDDEVVVSISFIARFSEDEAALDWSNFDTRHVQRCMELLSDESLGNWALDSLVGMCSVRSDLRQVVSQAAESARGIAKACLLFATGSDGHREVFDALSELLDMSSNELEAQPLPGLQGLEINWSGQEDLFVRLLRLRSVPLAAKLIEGVYNRSPRSREPVWKTNIGPIYWWLDWLQEEHNKHRVDDQWWFQDRLAYVLTAHVDPQKRAEFVAEFNKANSPYREVLSKIILEKIDDLSTDHLSEDAVSFLLANLSHEHGAGTFEPLLGNIATETFILERLLPLLPRARGRRRQRILAILRKAGRRHGRRYIPD